MLTVVALQLGPMLLVAVDVPMTQQGGYAWNVRCLLSSFHTPCEPPAYGMRVCRCRSVTVDSWVLGGVKQPR